jgi:hypothetical protein
MPRELAIAQAQVHVHEGSFSNAARQQRAFGPGRFQIAQYGCGFIKNEPVVVDGRYAAIWIHRGVCRFAVFLSRKIYQHFLMRYFLFQ